MTKTYDKKEPSSFEVYISCYFYNLTSYILRYR